MCKRIIFNLILTLLAVSGFAQQQRIHTLQEVLDAAIQHNPASKQKDVVIALGKQSESLLKAEMFPQVEVSEKNTFQSEVPSIDIPGFKALKKDNYNIGLDFRFPLTQFGMLKTQRDLDHITTELGLSKLDVEIQHLKERVANLFGNILLQKENRNVLLIRNQDLESQRKKVAAGVANGSVLKSNLLVFESEMLSTEQKLEDTDTTIKELIQQLTILTGVNLSVNDKYEVPSESVSDKAPSRPELQGFETQAQMLDLQADILKKENKPKIFVFGQGFYGRPGYDFLDTSFRPYGTVGLGIAFNINNVVNQSKRLNLIDLNKQVLAQEKANFEMNLKATLDPKKTEIAKYESILSKDVQILNNRKEIIRAANSQLENGVITSTEYLTELNAENAARLNLTLHKIQQAFAIVQYNTLLGY